MSRLILFYRLMLRPLLREPVRASLTVLAVALGVAVVLAIDLAGSAAAGSFRASMETLVGKSNLEAVTTGGVPENVVGKLETLPYSIDVRPRMEDAAVVMDPKRTLHLVGLDLLAPRDFAGALSRAMPSSTAQQPNAEEALKDLLDPDSVWVGASLGKEPGDHLRVLINDEVHEFTVRGVYPDAKGAESAIVMDIAAAQRALHRFGRVDRILLDVPDSPSLETWEKRLRAALPPGVEIRPEGAGTSENRHMLAAFRWNLQLLSYIALIVGAFLIYNTISVSVVRRRPEIGIVRAVGASRRMVLGAFVGEGAAFGLFGSAIGIPLGRIMAVGAVKFMAATVESLYVSSRPGPLALNASSLFLALVTGIGVAMFSALSPAREASVISPVEALARGRREYLARVRKSRDLYIAIVFALAAWAASRARAIEGKPLFGYFAALLLVVAFALATPAFTDAILCRTCRLFGALVGVEARLASQSLAASLRRTSVLVGALSTAIAMMTSVGIMVGSFRETVVLWMVDRLPADLYLGPAVAPAPDRHPTLALDLTEKIRRLPGVAGVDKLRAYEISYDGLPATLASVDLGAIRAEQRSNFFSGRSTDKVLSEIRNADAVLVSEPFTYKHDVRAGDTITLALGGSRVTFRIADVYYDYGSERGAILMDRQTMLRYLPDPAPSNLAIYVEPGTSLEKVRTEIEEAAANYRISIASNRELRAEAVRIFDRTFAITYALEAVAVLVAVMGVAGALLALVIDRRRELGLLRFLGGAAGQVRKQILVEAGLLGLLANVIGIALGFSLSLILIYVINKQSFGWTIRFHWPVMVLLGALSAVYGSTVLAGLYPARVAVRLNPLEAVHEE